MVLVWLCGSGVTECLGSAFAKSASEQDVVEHVSWTARGKEGVNLYRDCFTLN